jgi:hypothetical protein
VIAILLATLVLSQNPAPSPSPTPDPAKVADAAAKAADAAERAADAAQRAAEAAVTILKTQCPPVIAAAAAPAPPKAPPPDTTPWESTIGIGFIWLSGNSNTLIFNGTGIATKKWDGWGIGINAFGSYGQTSLTQGSSSQVNALAAGLKLRGSRDATPNVPIFIDLGIETNHIKSVESLTTADLGAGIIWAHEKVADFDKLLLRTDVSIHYEHETDFQYFPFAESLPTPSRELLGPRVALIFRYALRKDVIFTEDDEIIANVLNVSPIRVKVSSTTKIAARLTGSLSMTLSFQVAYDSEPPPTKVNTDTALMAGLEMAL